MKNKGIGFITIKGNKKQIKNDSFSRASRYNCTAMKDEIISYGVGFAENLSKLRNKKGISAREMSLSLGQGASYINDIENGRNLPSMAMFFEICEYLGTTPHEFFTYTAGLLDDVYLLLSTMELLSNEDKKLLIELIQRMQK